MAGDVDGYVEDVTLVFAQPQGPANRDIERLFSFDHLRDVFAADGCLYDVMNVGHADVPQRTFLTIDRQFDVALPADTVQADVLHAGHVDQRGKDLIPDFFQLVEIGAHDLDRVLSLHAREHFQHVIANHLRKVPVDAGYGFVELGAHRRHELRLGARPLSAPQVTPPARSVDNGWPIGLRLQRHEKLGAVKAGRVDAGIGPSELAHDRFDFWIVSHDGAGDPRLIGGLLQRDADGKDAADPDVPFFERRNEFARPNEAGSSAVTTIRPAKPPTASAR